MDGRITLKRAEAELRDISGEWRKIGIELGVGDLPIIGAHHGSYSERCLSEVLCSWIRNERNPSWNKLCNALENAGLQSKAKKLREKYSSPTTPGTQGEYGRILHYSHISVNKRYKTNPQKTHFDKLIPTPTFVDI